MAAAALGSGVFTGLVRRHALRRALLDLPNERSSHAAPTPRGGGLAIAAVILVGAAVATPLAHCPAGAASGWSAGDCWSGSSGGRMMSGPVRPHFAPRYTPSRRCGFWPGSGGWRRCCWESLGSSSGGWGTCWRSAPSSGVSTSTTSWTASTAWRPGRRCWPPGPRWRSSPRVRAGLALVAALIAGASLGFLWWNWAPARIFMGDVGSGLLGFLFAALALLSDRGGGPGVTTWLMLGGVFLVDATVTLVRRVLRGERWYAAHRNHAYQRAVQSGWSHRRVTLAALRLALAGRAAGLGGRGAAGPVRACLHAGSAAAGRGVSLRRAPGAHAWVLSPARAHPETAPAPPRHTGHVPGRRASPGCAGCRRWARRSRHRPARRGPLRCRR